MEASRNRQPTFFLLLYRGRQCRRFLGDQWRRHQHKHERQSSKRLVHGLLQLIVDRSMQSMIGKPNHLHFHGTGG